MLRVQVRAARQVGKGSLSVQRKVAVVLVSTMGTDSGSLFNDEPIHPQKMEC